MDERVRLEKSTLMIQARVPASEGVEVMVRYDGQYLELESDPYNRDVLVEADRRIEDLLNAIKMVMEVHANAPAGLK